MKETSFVGALLIGAGIAVAGYFVGDGFVEGRKADRLVTVKGVSERDVTADVALWPLRFVAASNDLSVAQVEIKKDYAAVLSFLEAKGISAENVEVNQIDVNDRQAQLYGSQNPGQRYIITMGVMVRVLDPQLIARASRDVGELVDAGVLLSSDQGRSGPTYLFNSLNDLKPEMIAEATAEARRAAEQFAADSQSKLGKIKTANQGVFVILPRDRAPGITAESQLQKTVRVVSTIDYYLKD